MTGDQEHGMDAAHRLDKRRVRASFERAASSYESVAVLQREVGRRLLERLELVRITPQRVLEIHGKLFDVVCVACDYRSSMAATLERVAGAENVVVGQKITGYEDFSYYQQRVPGFFYFVGITPKGTGRKQAAPNHSPRFFVDESALLQGTRSLAALAVDFLTDK